MTIHSRRTATTHRSVGTARTPSPSDLMTRLSQRGRRFPRLSSSFSQQVVNSMFLSHHISHCTVHKCLSPVGGHLSPQLEEIVIDFRVSGLPHAVVKQAENFRVLELVKKIESRPLREALQADLQQNNIYNPFSNNSKAMIRELGNVELFKLCETILKVQCPKYLICLESRSGLLHLWTSLG